MEENIGPGFDDVLVHEAGQPVETMSFVLIERTANDMADSMARGYGDLEEKNVPEFGAMARRTEAWLREIAEQARLHRGEQVRLLVDKGETDYCAKCHDAADEAR